MASLLEQEALEFIYKNNIDILNNKKILITGASGLLGVNLLSILRYSNFNFECTAVINSEPEQFFTDLIEGDNRIYCLNYDLTSSFEEMKLFLNEQYDIIFHFATYGQPMKILTPDNTENQLKTVRLNTDTLMNLFKLLKSSGKFIFMSSSEVYQGLDGELKEADIIKVSTEHERACCIDAKIVGEAICKIYKKQGYDVNVIRLCLGYGIGANPSDRMAINTFIYNALTNNNIDLLDDGSAVRTYCYVYDVLEMILNIATSGNELIYNVGGNEVVTIKQLADMIGNITGATSTTPLMNNNVEGANDSIILDLTRYNSEFGEKNFVSMYDGLQKTINWWKFLLNK